MFLIDVNAVAGLDIDVVRRVHDQIFERHGGAFAIALEHDPGGVALVLDAAGARDGVEDAVAGAGRGHSEAKRRVHLANDADERGPLLRQADDDLRLDRAVLDFLDDLVLDFDIGAPGGADHAGEGNGDVAVVVDGLIGKGDEIARPRAGVERDEQAARGRFEDRRRDDVADAEFDVGGGAAVGEGAGQPFRLIGRENVDRFGRELDQRVRRRLGFLASARQWRPARRSERSRSRQGRSPPPPPG